ncbi:Sugar kinase of the NBD/HSP70 family, may containing an N-terminal HTH domain [Streptoalloteichus tenebrarius]|uniref:Sugar kinase of the NBD/HSP70 family, may containing an N-terminal HTH domain n=1 Tax=Streptoalloteichus tenebrarius (strain ATCC 17920 / DSM 40477 / JCM 4838 / CBS 697.72 / NBRC 16177 / NCIMB 11028 / NRRL B-12390 / A12253. 1 / ISP 5477) TaxID=1933 RepID=A0ABT1HMW8_STRSD|nr:ROK family transcriptional regulator [Streptoalloteichus tenebrarius]MCP2256845.1 Sugar kinase of the NBD/HSP70 family, may containing an N-terminal HTH domain [Streptoalloteichus tenebrarius]BFF00248.1 ROK family transcriptional regulator [Streptoalloteichus tenebrarius]
MASPPTAGARPDDVRRHNRAALLRRLHVDGPCTRAALATELGLNRSTIKTLVDGLTDAGLVAEQVPTRRAGAGRPSLLVVPRATAVVVLAVDVGVEQLTVATVGIGGDVLGRRSWVLERGRVHPVDVVDRVTEARRRLADELGVDAVAVGVSVPGTVRRADGQVHEAPNLHWTDVPLGEQLSRVLRLPVQVGNDADLGGLAEHTRGAARNTADALYLSADVGVGGGVISGGVLLRGTGGYVGELGHMVVRPDGRQCYCGCRGCWETEVGEDAVRRALSLPGDADRAAIVAELRSLADDAELARHRLRGVADWLALGLANAVNLLAPELVVLGGLLAALPPSVVAEVEEVVRRRSMVARASGHLRVATAALGGEGPLLGAAELAFEPVLATV